MNGYEGLVAAIDALQANIAVLDRAGTIIAVNEPWRRFGKQRNAASDYLGVDYLGVCRKSAGAGDTSAQRVAAGLTRVLSQGASTYGHAYVCAERTFRMTARHLGEPSGAVIVAHEDITSLLKARRERLHSSQALSKAERDHLERLRKAREEVGQRLLAISMAATSLEDGGNLENALALIHLAVDEARHELRSWR